MKLTGAERERTRLLMYMISTSRDDYYFDVRSKVRPENWNSPQTTKGLIYNH